MGVCESYRLERADGGVDVGWKVTIYLPENDPDHDIEKIETRTKHWLELEWVSPGKEITEDGCEEDPSYQMERLF